MSVVNRVFSKEKKGGSRVLQLPAFVKSVSLGIGPWWGVLGRGSMKMSCVDGGEALRLDGGLLDWQGE